MKVPTVPQNASIKDCMKEINSCGLGIAFVVDKNGRLLGVVSDGDIRRAILSGKSLNSEVSEVMNRDPIRIFKNWSEEKLKKYLRSQKVRERIPLLKPLIVPVLSEDGKIVDLYPVYRDKKGALESQKVLKKPMKVLVVGGAGYIGSILVRRLLERGYKVTVLDNLLYGEDGIRELYGRENFKFVKGDVLHIDEVIEAMQDVDAVIHLAAVVGDPSCKLKPKETIEINYLAAKNLAESCKYLQIPRFIFASTCSVYGFNEGVCTEETEPNPLSLYAETKLMSEEGILSLADDTFFPTVLRFATVYGWSPRMRFDLVVNLLIAKAIFEGEITVYGRGKQYRPFVHVRDVARAIIKVLEAPLEKVGGEIFNVGSDEQNYSIAEMAHIIHENIPDSEIVFVDQKEDERSYRVSFEKIKETMGFEAKYSIKDAVLEIKREIEKGNVKHYKDKKYSNYKSLEALEYLRSPH
ncbi:MAG TPA: NAD-dependent epimerase/dehydratase family protein [Candidatus Aenigmarchaeota archaeon]|nr:NAD-dependent epimerase/dehydratase family protein [Candidatus Aenigmarchaeota archaeon]